MELIPINDKIKDQVEQFFITHWGSSEMVISSGIYQCDLLEGFAVLNEEGKIIGLVTYIFKNRECEIISLDSILENKGVGTSLVKAVEKMALEADCTRIKLITTNDNIHALHFYQKRGYVLSALYRNAVEKAREQKPEIPLIAQNGIPIRDELELEKRFI
ncbi:GNAT family N-acetyltransferase [Pseudalkalibacillus caeni]|uniref:GNAT family N-acetyltransferase n=1 Tax=Exobacillus caeni TaxID=2574798 RepID=A0A5R9F9L6_9BACL|nr:GNAT family N-acetyltransferase [Pseudalkalibacillus caeni]TLS37244.1 GNAT family N-acetyltransferase [Pseudalkalibacillus caeni]